MIGTSLHQSAPREERLCALTCCVSNRAPALMTTLEKHRTDLEIVRALHGAGVSVRAYNPLPGQLSGSTSTSGQLGLAGCSYLHLIMRPSEVNLLK